MYLLIVTHQSVTFTVVITNILLPLIFIGHLILRFRNKIFVPFFISWISFWISLFLQYVLMLCGLLGFLSYPLLIIVSLVSSLFLLLSSKFTLLDQEERVSNSATSVSWITWCAIFLLISIVCLVVSLELRGTIVNYASFLSLALYTGKYNQALPKTKQWIIVALYIYAGLSLHILADFYSPEPLLVTVILSLTVPLKILLYYSGYGILLKSGAGPSSIHIVQEIKDKTQKKLKSNLTSKAIALPPEPTVQIQLTGIWGFFYILWRYPSGKVVVVIMLASLIAAISFLANNVNTLISLFRK